MVDASLYAAFLAAALALCLTPGPDMMFIVAMGGRGGQTTGMMAALGVAFGALVHAVAAILGLSALFTALPVLYHVLRWAGAAYLLLLAWKAFRERGNPVGESGTADADADADTDAGAGRGADAGAGAGGGPGRRRAFWQGTVTNLLNPKVILFNVAFLPQFVNPDLGHVGGQLAVLALTLVLVGLAVDAAIGLLAGRLSLLLRRSRRVARGLSLFSGTVFAGLAVRLVATPD